MQIEAKKSRQLDEALEMTFPASDPTAVGDPTSTEPPRRPVDRRTPRISKAQVEAAAQKGRVHRSPEQGGKPDPNAPLEPVPNVKGKNRSRSSTQKGHGAKASAKDTAAAGVRARASQGQTSRSNRSEPHLYAYNNTLRSMEHCPDRHQGGNVAKKPSNGGRPARSQCYAPEVTLSGLLHVFPGHYVGQALDPDLLQQTVMIVPSAPVTRSTRALSCCASPNVSPWVCTWLNALDRGGRGSPGSSRYL